MGPRFTHIVARPDQITDPNNNKVRTMAEGMLDLTFFKIVSGGQTGADQAGLDWAIAHGVVTLYSPVISTI